MQVHVLKGTKQEIAEILLQLPGEVREVIVFVEEPIASIGVPVEDDIFAEMRPYMVIADDVDDSREVIYSRMDGE